MAKQDKVVPVNIAGALLFLSLRELKGQRPIVKDGPKVGRNQPCPCGSWRKFKHCCGGAQLQ